MSSPEVQQVLAWIAVSLQRRLRGEPVVGQSIRDGLLFASDDTPDHRFAQRFPRGVLMGQTDEGFSFRMPSSTLAHELAESLHAGLHRLASSSVCTDDDQFRVRGHEYTFDDGGRAQWSLYESQDVDDAPWRDLERVVVGLTPTLAPTLLQAWSTEPLPPLAPPETPNLIEELIAAHSAADEVVDDAVRRGLDVATAATLVWDAWAEGTLAPGIARDALSDLVDRNGAESMTNAHVRHALATLPANEVTRGRMGGMVLYWLFRRSPASTDAELAPLIGDGWMRMLQERRLDFGAKSEEFRREFVPQPALDLACIEAILSGTEFHCIELLRSALARAPRESGAVAVLGFSGHHALELVGPLVREHELERALLDAAYDYLTDAANVQRWYGRRWNHALMWSTVVLGESSGQISSRLREALSVPLETGIPTLNDAEKERLRASMRGFPPADQAKLSRRLGL